MAITDEAYTQAYSALHGYLGAVLGAAPVDVIEVEWFPGSYSSEGVERMPDLVGKLQADFPGKLIIVGTGYSTAAGADARQTRSEKHGVKKMCRVRRKLQTPASRRCPTSSSRG